jgi:hypothetical protein
MNTKISDGTADLTTLEIIEWTVAWMDNLLPTIKGRIAALKYQSGDDVLAKENYEALYNLLVHFGININVAAEKLWADLYRGQPK